MTLRNRWRRLVARHIVAVAVMDDQLYRYDPAAWLSLRWDQKYGTHA